MADNTEVVVPPVVVPEPVIEDPIAAKDAEILKLTEERDNYKTVALKRLGKLPGDANYIAGEETELSVQDQIKIALLDKELEKANKEKEAETARIVKENSELKLALKNRPGAPMSGGSGEGLKVKDNVLSDAQIEELRKRAIRLKADPEKFIETAKQNLLKQR